ncbi:MAG: hypothetical protein HYX34_03165 [Actinobacteria bacterium]|nr:hypothetical protein [Actinomycetota bacterium]
MSRPVRRWGAPAAAFVALVTLVAVAPAEARPAPPSASTGTSAATTTAANRIRYITKRTARPFPTGQKVGTPPAGGVADPETWDGEGAAESKANRSLSARPTAGTAVAPSAAAPRAAVSSTSLTVDKSWTGLTMFDQRFANGGNQFSVEPPDQALCVGNGYVVEGTNTVMQIFKADSTPLTPPTDLNSFYGYPAQINRTTGEQGPFITDPNCYYDPENRRFIFLVLTLDVDPATGELLGSNHLDIAVSNTANPLGAWSIYSLPVQNDGTQGTPRHMSCPCLGDYPHIGADRYGFYITTNEYPLTGGPGGFGNGFNGAQIYALSKAQLASLAPTLRVVQFESLRLRSDVGGFTVWPATSSPGDYATDNGGAEYFLSSTAAEEALGTGSSNNIGVWKMTRTSTLDTTTPAPVLARVLVGSIPYSIPPLAEQKYGPTPLRDCLAIECLPGIGPSRESFPSLDANDTRMQQVWYSRGRIYGALDTAAEVSGEVKASIAWFIVNAADKVANVSMANQGYLTRAGTNLTYPAIAMLPSGVGVMAFTLVGPDNFPSAGYAPMGTNGPATARVVAAGRGPQDGFTGYQFFNAPDPTRPRWGDYGAATVYSGRLFTASEFIAQSCNLNEYRVDPTCARTRGALANWATRISVFSPTPAP